eukprot:COSAG01_NODE_67155_length_268_cov_0.532544_1_plen_29_part_01
MGGGGGGRGDVGTFTTSECIVSHNNHCKF